MDICKGLKARAPIAQAAKRVSTTLPTIDRWASRRHAMYLQYDIYALYAAPVTIICINTYTIISIRILVIHINTAVISQYMCTIVTSEYSSLSQIDPSLPSTTYVGWLDRESFKDRGGGGRGRGDCTVDEMSSYSTALSPAASRARWPKVKKLNAVWVTAELRGAALASLIAYHI